MNNLVAQMMGRKTVHEDVPVPVGVPRSTSRRDRRSVQRRTAAAAMIGMAEAEGDDESIIPDDAEEIENISGPSGVRISDKVVKADQEPDEPDGPSEIPGSSDDQMMSPRDALVAPDVTPQAMEPIDASEVPQAKGQQQAYQAQGQQGQVPKFVPPNYTVPPNANNNVNPMDVLLGRTSTRPSRPEPEPENVVTAESAQASVNAMLNVGGASGNALLAQGSPMPEPKAGDASKIMEAFSKYGPKPTWKF